MTKKQTFSFVFLWLFTIGTFGLGFSWLVSSGSCDLRAQDISRLTDNQDDLLLSYKTFDSSDQEGLRAIINQKENLIKIKIEHFKEFCHSKRYKRQLVSILKLYGIYLLTKQVTLHEKQDFDWHQSLFPVEFAFKK